MRNDLCDKFSKDIHRLLFCSLWNTCSARSFALLAYPLDNQPVCRKDDCERRIEAPTEVRTPDSISASAGFTCDQCIIYHQ
ncbi:hypothetical protein HGRIS_000582 [Hohenbuehelia grisea]|uniref:Uncharacterized protein n=1 Tax=Hohenbuehelia grisea TaxID=104357 RepID=A0ABR3JRL5_9AGAR